MLISAFSLLGQAQVALLHRRYLRAISLLDYSRFELCEYKGEYFMIHVVPTGTYPVYQYPNRIGFGKNFWSILPSHSP